MWLDRMKEIDEHEEQMGNRHDGARVTAPLFAFNGFQHTEPNRLFLQYITRHLNDPATYTVANAHHYKSNNCLNTL